MCGLAGIVVHKDVAPEIYDALTVLQIGDKTLLAL